MEITHVKRRTHSQLKTEYRELVESLFCQTFRSTNIFLQIFKDK